MHLHGISFGFAIFLYIRASFIAFSTSLYSKGLYFFAFDLKSFLQILHVHITDNWSISYLQLLQNNLFFFIQNLSSHSIQDICSLIIGFLQ